MKLCIQVVSFVDTATRLDEVEAETKRRALEAQASFSKATCESSGSKVVHFPKRDGQNSGGASKARATLYAVQVDPEADS